jgi:phospholipase/carboxylesterase
MLETIIIESKASSKPEYAVIWLHGLGANGNDFVPIAYELQNLVGKPLRFIFPHAPLRPVTLNNGYIMRAWYDITGLHRAAREDKEGLTETSEYIYQLIQQQIQLGVLPQNIFLAGFSQGGASVLYAGLRYSQKLAGLIILSGYLPLGKNLESEKHSANQDVSIFWGHGIRDNIVPLQWAEISDQQLKTCGFEKQNFYKYPMAHEVCRKEIKDMGLWMMWIIKRKTKFYPA